MASPPELLVLVADDDDDIRTTLRDALHLEGHSVVLARDGEEALALLHAGALPCAIVLDWLMPTMGGDAFLAAREQSPDLRAIPVFIVSASRASKGDPRVQGFLPKPFELGALLDLLGSVCSESCARRDCPARAQASGSEESAR
jgi:CheY-like chemotaxis protein